MMSIAIRAFAALAILCLACCTPPAQGPSASASGEPVQLEAYCDKPGFSPSLRHTYLLLDENALVRTATPEAFDERNRDVRNLIVSFGSARAAESGLSDYRERISVFILPADGSAAKLIFEGCLPAASPDELRRVHSRSSALNDFVNGGFEQTLSEDADAFALQLANSVAVAAQAAPETHGHTTPPFATSNVVQSLRASSRLVNATSGLPRVILLANLAQFDFGGVRNGTEARTAGFRDAAAVGLDLGRAELHAFLVRGPNADLAREYAHAFFLAQHANLLSWSDNVAGTLPLAPSAIARYAGQAQYPHSAETIQIRLATDRNGNLVNSWVVLRGTPDRSTPLTGQQTCNRADSCVLRSDDGGFAQAWSLTPGAAPAFSNDAPFGGVRDWEFNVSGARLTGRVFDPAVQIGDSNSISVEAQAVEGALF